MVKPDTVTVCEPRVGRRLQSAFLIGGSGRTRDDALITAAIHVEPLPKA